MTLSRQHVRVIVASGAASGNTRFPESGDDTAAQEQTLSAFLDQIVRRFGDRPALLYKPDLKTQVWSYHDLRIRADRVTRWLQEQGVGKGDRIILWAPNSPWWVAAFFGILRNGSVVVPLDVRSGPDFVRRVIDQSEPVLAIATATVAKDWTLTLPVVGLENLEVLAPVRGADAFPDVRPEDLAEIIFTSGTTGAPKGVMLTHWNIRSNVEATNLVVPAGPGLRPLSILPLSHLLEQTVGMMLPLSGGTSVAFATALQPAAIQRDMAEYRVTTMIVVPRILSMFMEAIERQVKQQGKERIWELMGRVADRLPRRARRVLFRSVIRRFGGRLDFFVTGGAPLEVELERKWERMGIAVLQGYGSTETSPIITATALEDRYRRSVGKALPGTELILADDGEILVKGPQVMQGYWRNPEATAEALVGGYYHTGDLGELDAEGRLFLKGRKKNMIVLANGLNVFPEDVEEVLRRVPGVADAIVMAAPSDYGPQVHAVLLGQTRGLDGEAVVRQANAELAPHQQVRSFDVWPEPDFPRTHTIKVKRAEVAKYVLAEQREKQATSSQPAGAESRKPRPVEVLAAVLGKPVDELTPETHLADLGLDPLGRMRLGRAIEDRLGKFVDDARIGPATTVGDLDSLLSSQHPSGEHSYPLWPFSHRIRFIRHLLQRPIFAAIDSVNRPQVIGREKLDELATPAIFVMRYESYLDAPFALDALPDRFRERIGISTTWKTDRRSRLIGDLVGLVFNSFRYSPVGSLHATLVHAAGLLDHGWSILFLVRDSDTSSGQTESLARGIGLLASEFEAPTLPIVARGLKRSSLVKPIPDRGSVTIRFGPAIPGRGGPGRENAERAVAAALVEASR